MPISERTKAYCAEQGISHREFRRRFLAARRERRATYEQAAPLAEPYWEPVARRRQIPPEHSEAFKGIFIHGFVLALTGKQFMMPDFLKPKSKALRRIFREGYDAGQHNEI